jgi:hypothetical protein
MTRKLRLSRKNSRTRSERSGACAAEAPTEEYQVGPGRPPRQFQFKPGQSGNPKGASRKPRSIAPDVKALFEGALRKKVKLTQGEQERIMSKAEVGIEQLVNQFAKGDHRARRDLIALARILGVNLAADQGQAIEKVLEAAVTANDEVLVADFLYRHGVGRDHRGDDSDAGLPPGTEKPGGSDPGEQTT